MRADARKDNMALLLEPWIKEKIMLGAISANVKSLEVNGDNLDLNISCEREMLDTKYTGKVRFYLGEILAKPTEAFKVRTGFDSNEKELSFLAKVSTTSINSYAQETFNGLITALEKNDRETFAVLIETFDGPVEFLFSMSGFENAIEPVKAFCPAD